MDEIFEAALEKMLISANGDMRGLLRALLVENVRLQAELDRRGETSPYADRTNGRKIVLH